MSTSKINFTLTSLLTIVVALSLLTVGCDTIKQSPIGNTVTKTAENTVGTENVRTVEKVGDSLAAAYKNFSAAFEEMPLEDERALGETVALQAYATKDFGAPIKNQELMMFMNCMANVIGQHSDRPMISYHIAVIKSDDLNAFSAPGGYIFVTSGLIMKLDTEAELAMVIGHEIAHITRKHAVRTLQNSKAMAGVGNLASAGVKLTSATFDASEENFKGFESLVTSLAENVVGHNYDSATEIESDQFGAQYAMQTGYDPHAILTLLDKLAVKDHVGDSTHPTAASRKAAMDTWLGKQNEDYNQLVSDTGRMSQLKAWIQAASGDEWK